MNRLSKGYKQALDKSNISSPCNPARALDFLARRALFFKKNDRNLETKSRKNWSQGGKWTVSPRATNRPLAKKTEFRAENRVFWPKKKESLLDSNLVLAMTGKVVQTKKYPFPKKISVF